MAGVGQVTGDLFKLDAYTSINELKLRGKGNGGPYDAR